jgi:hypothetical protein
MMQQSLNVWLPNKRMRTEGLMLGFLVYPISVPQTTFFGVK